MSSIVTSSRLKDRDAGKKVSRVKKIDRKRV